MSIGIGGPAAFIPYLLWAGTNLVPVTHHDLTGDCCSRYTCSTDPESGSDYRVVMTLTLAPTKHFVCQTWRMDKVFYKSCDVSYLVTVTKFRVRYERSAKKGASVLITDRMITSRCFINGLEVSSMS